MRVFVAVNISEEVRREVARRIDFLRAEFPNLRVGWDKPEKLHLTLKFLGEIDEQQLQDLTIAAEKAVQSVPPFGLTIESAGAFPPRGAAKVLWLGVNDESGSLRELNKRLENECAAVGFERETRDFKPHLTIARLKEPEKSRELTKLHLQTDFSAASFQVSEITIMKSDLLPQGSRYTTLKQIKLAAD